MTHHTPWHGTEAGYLTAIARAAARRPAQPADWTPPTGDTWPLVCVAPNEMTCCECGETFAAGSICTRCNTADEETGERRNREEMPPAVPTLAYLKEDEYRMVG